MKGKWVKDYCPFAKDQGFDSVVGNVAQGETIFGFQHLHSGVGQRIDFTTATNGKVHQMADANYKVLVTKSASAAYGPAVVSPAYVYEQYNDHFRLLADDSEWYDIVVIGKVLY